jgi:hypothetical protein
MNTLNSAARATAALGFALGTAAFLAPGAMAYTGATTQCNGASIVAGGASFQKAAQQTVWGADELNTASYVLGTTTFASLPVKTVATKGFGFAGAPGGAGACTGRRAAGKKVGYASVGSGAGRNSWSANGTTPRDKTAAFVATDEPADATEESKIETVGLTAATVSETIPVAQGAVALIVNLPTGCTLKTTAARTATLTNLEKVMYGDAASQTWGALLGAANLTPASCATTKVKRAARFDSSGTTFALKKVLQAKAARWATYTTPANNTVWPNNTGAYPVLKPTTAGNGPLVSLVSATAGSLGYSDLATARAAGFDFAGTSDRTFWLRLNVPSASGSVTVDPALNSTPGTTTKGASCGTNRVYTNEPASTQNNWFDVIGAKATYAAGEYPVCTLTYVIAYDRYRNVPTFTESQTRTVFDYTNWMVASAGGQSVLASADYQALPAGTRTKAAAGAARIDF